MKNRSNTVFILFVAMLFCGLITTAFAQPDPPSCVARLNLIEGSVSFLPSGGDQNDWVAALPNRPVTIGDRLWADQNSHAELHIGSTAIRMDRNTGISFLNLDDSTVQIRVSDGSIIVRLRSLDQGNIFEIDTSNVAFAISQPGYYRIDNRPEDNVTVITVRQGAGEATGGGRSFQIISDQQVTLAGTDSLTYDLQDADSFPTSEFDKWAMQRDVREDHILSARYVSPDMTGYEDLDYYGTWRVFPEYGNCWVPTRLPSGWAPYRFGQWVWIAPWGWTWVDDMPWGFAPFHYGRWAYAGSSWVWVPGPLVARPVYAPALVAWVGGGNSGFSVSLGAGGGIGWFPLGPREVFIPAYHASERYVTNVNITNTVVNRTTVINLYNNRSVAEMAYINRRAPDAVTVVSRETFVNARPVRTNILRVPSGAVTSAPVVRNVPVAPERTSVYGPGNRNVPHPPPQSINRVVVTRGTPAREPNHFEQTLSNRPPNQVPDRRPNRATPERPNSRAGSPQQQRPLFRPAPPVRPPSATERAEMQAKEKSWESAHQRNHQNQSQSQDQSRGRRREH